jgi:hypothetical protein
MGSHRNLALSKISGDLSDVSAVRGEGIRHSRMREVGQGSRAARAGQNGQDGTPFTASQGVGR